MTDQRLGRRGVLRAGLLAALASPVLVTAAACTDTDTAATPDAMLPMLTSARKDAALATAAAKAFIDNAATFSVIATVRDQHATAIQKEITRVGGTLPSSGSAAPSADSNAEETPAGTEADTTDQLVSALRTAQSQAAALVPGVPRYRAGLVGSVSAGCASLLEALGK